VIATAGRKPQRWPASSLTGRLLGGSSPSPHFPMSATPPHTRDEALWAEEVARLLEGSATLAPAARQLVANVLASFLADATIDTGCRRDARTLLNALRRPAPISIAA
jgi:hypothetical protein